MTLRGSSLPARRASRTVAPLLLAALTLTACSDDEPTAAPTRSPSTTAASPSATVIPSPTASATSTTTTDPSADPSVTASTTPSASSGESTPQGPATRPSASGGATRGTTSSSCPAATAGPVNTTGMTSAAAAKARTLHAAAVRCDAQALVRVATADQTGLAGERAPGATFTSSATQNFVWLATLLSMTPTTAFDGTIAPKVFSEQFAQTQSEWDRVVDAGLVTRQQASTMRAQDGGYTGPRTGLAEDGTWTFFTTGR